MRPLVFASFISPVVWVTCVMLFVALDDNDDGRNDYIGYYTGDNSTSANRPQLVVTFQ